MCMVWEQWEALFRGWERIPSFLEFFHKACELLQPVEGLVETHSSFPSPLIRTKEQWKRACLLACRQVASSLISRYLHCPKEAIRSLRGGWALFWMNPNMKGWGAKTWETFFLPSWIPWRSPRSKGRLVGVQLGADPSLLPRSVYGAREQWQLGKYGYFLAPQYPPVSPLQEFWWWYFQAHSLSPAKKTLI